MICYDVTAMLTYKETKQRIREAKDLDEEGTIKALEEVNAAITRLGFIRDNLETKMEGFRLEKNARKCDRSSKGIREGNKEGFWYPEGKYIPKERKPWEGQKEFLKKFKKLDKICMSCECISEKEECWICDKPLMISCEHMKKGQTWAGTYYHYISKHNIKPSKTFIEFVMNYKFKE